MHHALRFNGIPFVEQYVSSQFLDIREYHRRLLPTGIATTLLPEEEEEEEPLPEGEDEPSGDNAAEAVDQDSDDMSDESEHLFKRQYTLFALAGMH
jgi:hypothetical protein